MNTFAENRSSKSPDEGIDYKKLIYLIISKWYWVLISIVICLMASFIYLRYKTPSYNITARVLVNDEKKGAGMLGGADMLGDLGGLLGAKSTVDNEAEILKTRFLMEQVVRDLNLDVTYYRKGKVKNEELYEAPFKVQIVNGADTILSTNVNVTLLKNNRVGISANELDTTVTYRAPFRIPKVGVIKILKNSEVPALQTDYTFNITSVDSRVANLMSLLTVEVKNKLITIVDLNLKYPIPRKGEVILNKLIEKYVAANLKDKNEVADSTVKFIQNRLAYIGSELGDLEGNIQGFKQRNSLADMTEQSKQLVQITSDYVKQLAQVETQISILRSLQEYLKDEDKNKRVLPSSLVPADMVFSGAVEKYNQLTLERARRLIGVTESNPSIILIDKEIENARADIEANLSTTLDGFVITRNKIRSQMQRAEAQVKEVPQIERSYLNLARQQQIKQELYIFLMQKSEETAISKTSNISNSKTIDPPKSDVKPFSPNRMFIYLIGLIVGIALPIGIIYLVEILNDRIQSKEDIAQATQAAIIGEISHCDDNTNLVVANSSRSAISEQFRALRTNLSFFLKDNQSKVILLTSSMSGEGKSFVAINLGNILALSDKKVLLMELDLRKPGLSVKLGINNDIGFTNYIIDDSLTSDDIVKPLEEVHKNLFIISSGPVPPNPAEMLLNERTKILIDRVKEDFDYVIIDSPPVGIVTDAQLLADKANLCMYLVRQNYTLKSQLSIVEDLRISKKIKDIGVVVNDIEISGSYGYGYGYGYGYVYGSYENQKKSSIWRRITKG